jgi:hypothetical protein
LAWTDVNWKEVKLAVSAKPQFGFTPKNYEECTVPIPEALIEAIRERKKHAADGSTTKARKPRDTPFGREGRRPQSAWFFFLGVYCRTVAFLKELDLEGGRRKPFG